LGCGAGLDAIFMAEQGLYVLGVDSSRKALKIARSRADKKRVKVEWLAADLFDLPLENEAIDFVTDRGLFHVIDDNDRPRYSSEVRRILKPKGFVMIRGASENVGQDRFNAVTKSAVDRFFQRSEWSIGPVVSLPLFSPAGEIDARMVILEKKGEKSSKR